MTESVREGLLVEKDKVFLSTLTSKFNPIDIEALNVEFVSSTEDDFIPSFDESVENLTDFPKNYLLLKLHRPTISKDYWKELHIGLPESESVEIQWWPGENGAKTGKDLADPTGRKNIIISLLKIREFLLNNDDEEEKKMIGEDETDEEEEIGEEMND
ncbi:hypothetical protein C1645_842099 [Glomus cerebriforme]|uniref:Uncharacterized protein n=1 Tax=Glomus cerebriforme TaxID=658196 RepID=A0A397S2D8_9GLOM|nr:hypothetical protein C1645_842099 [Glomus cerebriforme]